MAPRNRIIKDSPEDPSRIRFSSAERTSLRELARSKNVHDRRRCVDLLHLSSDVRANKRFVLDLAGSMIGDRSEYVRWQAAILLGTYVEERPEAIWPWVLKWGSSRGGDIRAATACCVLEHLLQYHFELIFRRCRAEMRRGNRLFARTVIMCGKFGQSEEPENARRLDQLKREHHDA